MYDDVNAVVITSVNCEPFPINDPVNDPVLLTRKLLLRAAIDDDIEDVYALKDEEITNDPVDISVNTPVSCNPSPLNDPVKDPVCLPIKDPVKDPVLLVTILLLSDVI